MSADALTPERRAATPADVLAIRARYDAAEIAGPWEAGGRMDPQISSFDESYNVFPMGDECGPICEASTKGRANFIAGAATDIPALLALVTEQGAELDRYKRVLARPLTISAWEWCQGDPEGASFGAYHPMTAVIVEALAEQLTMTGAVNRVSFSGEHPTAGAIECTIQRVGRVTPEEARLAAEAALGRAVAALRALGGTWDEPMTYAPPPPPCEGEAEEGRQPWCRLDFRRRPNVLRCLRCGGEQEMPALTTPEVGKAMIEAFLREHAGCHPRDGEEQR